MKVEEVTLTWYQNVILALKVYFKVIPFKYQIVTLVIATPLLTVVRWTNSKGEPAPFFLVMLFTAIVVVMSHVLIFGFGPLIIDLIKTELIPYIQLHTEREKVKLQKASLEKVDDILLKK